MRKLVTAGVVAAAALSWAHVARAEDAAQKRKEAASATQREMKQDAQRAKQETQHEVQHSRDAMTRGESSKGMERKSRFEGKDNFDMKGKLSKVSHDSITIAREDLPAATLKISHDTKIEVGGDKATAAQLRQGEDVKATFNLEGDKPVAVEIKADKPKESGEKANRGEPTTK
jgi:hypothetical protein